MVVILSIGSSRFRILSFTVTPSERQVCDLRIAGLDGMFDISPNLTHALLRAGCGSDERHDHSAGSDPV
jgi:hypothetical protein